MCRTAAEKYSLFQERLASPKFSCWHGLFFSLNLLWGKVTQKSCTSWGQFFFFQ